MAYKRRNADRAILKALASVGGSASRDKVKSIIAESDESGFSYNDVYEPVISKAGNKYIPFDFDFNFGIRELAAVGYLEDLKRGEDITLTEKGRVADYDKFPSKEEQEEMSRYWRKMDELRKAKNDAKKQVDVVEDSPNPVGEDAVDDADAETEDWKVQLLAQLKLFTPKKFESFSRLLISKMGVKIDQKLGIITSGDHGIDGFGYFESDEFRTSRVAIQAKRYTDGSVSEPEIDKFKGVMDGFNAEYGIFITTSHFTPNAKKKAVTGSNSVTLIDGQRIVELVEKYKLHITPVQTFTLDNYYFQQD